MQIEKKKSKVRKNISLSANFSEHLEQLSNDTGYNQNELVEFGLSKLDKNFICGEYVEELIKKMDKEDLVNILANIIKSRR